VSLQSMHSDFEGPEHVLHKLSQSLQVEEGLSNHYPSLHPVHFLPSKGSHFVGAQLESHEHFVLSCT
jgi:hypothetical protein